MKKELIDKLLTSGLSIAILTFLGYALTFSYKYGYVAFFNIPTTFISINLTEVMFFTLTLFIILTLLLSCTYIVKLAFSDSRIFYFQEAVGITVFSIATIFFYLLLNAEVNLTVFAITFCILITILAWIFQIFSYLENKTESKFKLMQKIRQKTSSQVQLPLDIFRNFNNKNLSLQYILTTLIIFIGLIGISMSFGQKTAKSQTKFYAPVHHQNFLFIETKDNLSILVEYTENKFSNNLLIMNTADLGELRQIEIETEYYSD